MGTMCPSRAIAAYFACVGLHFSPNQAPIPAKMARQRLCKYGHGRICTIAPPLRKGSSLVDCSKSKFLSLDYEGWPNPLCLREWYEGLLRKKFGTRSRSGLACRGKSRAGTGGPHFRVVLRPFLQPQGRQRREGAEQFRRPEYSAVRMVGPLGHERMVAIHVSLAA